MGLGPRGEKMRPTSRMVWRTVMLAVCVVALEPLRARGQSIVPARSLGGYGATSTSPMAAMGSASSMIPYAGGFGGFMPYRMASGSGSGLSFSPRASSMPESSRTSFRLSPMPGAMRIGSSDRFRPRGEMGVDRGPLMSQPMGGNDRTSVMPPSFGYPFYQPPSLLAPGGSVVGMSM